MRPDRGAEQVVRAVRIGHPVAQRLVDRRAQRLVAARDRHDLGAEQLHAPDVRRLALHVDRAHVDDAGHAEPRAGRGRSDAVLARAGLRDDALRAEPLGEQRLADRVVDLVRARVREILALQPDLGAPAARQLARQRERRRASDPGAQLALELGAKAGSAQVGAHALLEPVERRHQRLGHVAPAERAEAAALVGKRAAQRLRRAAPRGRSSGPRLSSSILLGNQGLLRRAGRPDEFTDPRRVLDAAAALDARADVHAERADRAHRLADVGRVESAGQHQLARSRDTRRCSPVGALARAAARALEQAAWRQRTGDAPLRCAARAARAVRSATRSAGEIARRRSAPSRARSPPAPRRAAPATDAGTRRRARCPPARPAAVRAPRRGRRCAATCRGTRTRPHPRPHRPRRRSPRACAGRRS